MKYFFILGRNPELSLAEIYCYFESRSIKFETLLVKKNFLVLNFEKDLELDIQDFGGIIKLGKVLFHEKENKFNKYLNDYIVDLDKFSFCVTGNFSEDVEEALMEKFKSERVKAQVRHGRSKLKLQKGDYVLMPNADIEFFFFKEDDKTIFFGKVDQDYSHQEVKERDMKKPFRRESLAISPRLSKILVNITGVRKGELLLDCFCGVGGIIQEALIKGINCYGIDKDRLAIEAAKKNLKWLSQHYDLQANYNLLNADSRNAPNIRVDGVATEPALGELMRRKLRDNEAREFIERFERLIVPVLTRVKQIKKPDARIAITLPYIREFSVNIDKVCKLTGLRRYNIPGVQLPIQEVREGQFIAREIIVLV